jgi:hypothetical protein
MVRVIQLPRGAETAKARSRDFIFGPGMFWDSNKGYRQVGNGNRCEFSSFGAGKREADKCHARLF